MKNDEIELWKAYTSFGREQVTKTLEDPQWHQAYPEVFARLESANEEIKYDTLIPLHILRAIASAKPYQYAFGSNDNILKCRPRPEDLPPGFKELSPLEALEEFGGERVFDAVDGGTSMPDNN